MTSDEWPVWRSLRLRALAESPDSFRETAAETEVEPDEYWIDMLVPTVEHPRGLLLFAEVDGVRVGKTFARIDSDFEAVSIGSMWVAPEARGRGVGRALAAYALDWGVQRSVAVARLWVTDGNDAAVHLYESLGFTPLDATEELRAGSDLTIRRMELQLATV